LKLVSVRAGRFGSVEPAPNAVRYTRAAPSKRKRAHPKG
jgi:hypothetical protein